MQKNKKKTNNKKQKDKFATTKVRHDGTYEVEIQKHPNETVTGKVIIFLLIFGMVGILLVGLVMAIVQVIK